MSTPEEATIFSKALDWGWTVLIGLLVYFWNAFRGEITSMKNRITLLEAAVPNERERENEREDNKNMRENVIKIFDRLDSMQQQSHEQYVALTNLINTKADK